MKRGTLGSGSECSIFGDDSKLNKNMPNTFNFKPKSHIYIYEIEGWLLDSLWYQFKVKSEEKGYILSSLNSLAEYFNMLNKNIPKTTKIEIKKNRFYVLCLMEIIQEYTCHGKKLT
ncbi:hypothetical protein ZWY2020_025480 [Hordeum vulgare]|nr:hypothetical protein ZWY2020_025480 [Hordeum vulgare]